MDKRFVGILVAVIFILGGIFWLTSSKNTNTPSTSNSSSTNQATQHIEGQGKDGITLTEYGDYECPYCGQYFPIVQQVQQEYNTQIFFQFRNLPLTEIHPNAFAGARAAEAADLQNKFWQMHDALYANQNQWVTSSNPQTFFDAAAKQLGLNVTKFDQDFGSNTVNNRINADEAAFNKTGAPLATPTFFLDGKLIQPAESVASFETLINAEIKKKGFTPPATTPSTTSPSSGTTPQSKQ